MISIAKGDVCEVCGSTNDVRNSKKFGMILCKKHYQQMYRHGRIFNRTKFDHNEIVIYEDYAEVVLYNANGNEVARTLIDTEDITRVSSLKWYLNNSGYVKCDTNKCSILLHKFIVGESNGLQVDHINGIRTDNRKTNLRLVTNSQNNMNKGLQLNNSSGYTGVYWDKERNKWHSQIKFNGKHIDLGRFSKIEDAIATRKKAEEEYFGEYAYKEVSNGN